MKPTQRPLAATGSGGTATISVKEEDGKRTTTSEKSSLVQERDGYLESKEVAAEVVDKDSQAARREASTRMMKHDEDPHGRFKKSESADASDVSETCVKQMPDGSVMTVKKSSTSTSNFKQSFSTGGGGNGGPLMFNQDFPSRMDSFNNFMGGPSLMSQMSSDSLASNRSSFSDMSNFSRMSDMSNMSNFSNRPFPSMQGFPEFPDMRRQQMSAFSDFPDMRQPFGPPQPGFHPMNQSNNSSFSSHSSFSTSSSTQQHKKF